jgi:hypothetical protein
MTKTRLALTAGLLSLGLITLSGCSAVDAMLYKYSTTTYDDVAAMQEDGVDATWIPKDATEIVVRTSVDPDASDAVTTFQTSSALPDADCVEVERRSAPVWSLDGMPDVYSLAKVFACGDWSVVPTEDGWAAWTPNSSDERKDASAAP